MINIEIFRVNEVYEDSSTNKLERILWIDSNYEYCYTIKLNTKRFIIQIRDICEFEKRFAEGAIRYFNYVDITKYIQGETISEKSKKLLNENWKIIKFITSSENEPYIYNAKDRSEIIKKAINEFSTTKATIYKYLKKYWQGGKLKIALIPEYYKCGGKGKEKKLGDKKVGRRNYISYIDPEKVGINLTDELKRTIDMSIVKFYSNHKETSLEQAYRMMKAEYFTEKHIDENGDLIEKSLLAHKIPTSYQFKNRYYKNRDIQATLEKRKSKKDFELNHAPILSNAKYHALGPGYIYEIDSTIPPIYLINRINNKGIGKPVVYYVIDVFSCMIAGVFIGAGFACYEGAISAIYNCTEDKVNFCKQYGLEIQENEWPNSGLPLSLRADRGELVAKLPENIIDNLNITIETTASYMGKMKGTVEQNFNVQERKLKPYLDGIIESDFRKRGGSDARKKANMTIEEFTKSVLRAIIHHNKHKMKNYPLVQGMINDDINSTPAEVWNWGIKNISGALREIPDEYVKLNLMRRGRATVTKRGMRFGTWLYNCNTANIEGWYTKARNCGYWDVDVRYDPRWLNIIYIINSDSSKFEACSIRDEETIYLNRTYDEIISYEKDKKVKEQSVRDIENENYLRLHKGLKKDAEEAGEKSAYINKRTLVKDININKKIENYYYGKKQAISLVERADNVIIENVIIDSKVEDSRKNLFDKILKMRGGN